MFFRACICISFFASAVMAVDINDSDFANHVEEYVQGGGVPFDWIAGYCFNSPDNALGAPTLVTTGDDSNPNDSFTGIPVSASIDVSPVYGPFRYFEIVSIGKDGYITLKFDHPVADDPQNPYGIDFIIFGNARQTLVAENYWTVDSDANDVSVIGQVNSENGIVSVSQDGNKWYTFTDGPYADSFAPTASRSWDCQDHCWTELLNPTKPINPNLTAQAMAGRTVAQILELYNGSAGGTGFDIAGLDSGLKWIQYVRIADDPCDSCTTEIDAVADVTACGDYRHPFPAGDLNEDCRVNMLDLTIAANTWFTNRFPLMDVVDTWLDCTWMCN